MRKRVWVGSLSLLLFSTTSVPAQEPPTEPFGETIDVHLVTIEVSVQPFYGERPLMEFGPEDFAVYEDGERQTITHFERVRDGRVEGATSGTEPAGGPSDGVVERRPQSIVLAFDESSLSLIRLHQAVAQVIERVRTHPGETRWAVAVLGSDPRILLPFSTDPDQVVAALESVVARREGRRFASWSRGSYLRSRASAPSQAPTLRPGQEEGKDPVSVDFDERSVEELVGELESRERAVRAEELFAALAELFQGWSTVEGDKSLVMFYEPFAGSLVTPRTMTMEHGIGTGMERLARLAAAAGFTFHAADASGLTNPRFGGPSVASWRSVAESLAVATGGRHLAVNDLSRVVELASIRSRNHYRISFQVPRAADGESHDLQVKLLRPGIYRVRHPWSYLDLAPRDRLLGQLQTSANIPKTAEGLPLEFVVRAGEILEGDLLPLETTVALPPDRLGYLWDEDSRTGEVEFFFALYGADGQLLALDSQKRTVEAGQSPSAPLVQRFSTRAPAAEYTVVVAALDGVDGTSGMAFTRIHP